MASELAQRKERANWVWLSLIPLGLGAWAPAYAGVRTQNRRWLAIGLAWAVIALAGWIVSAADHGASAGGLLIIVGWTGGAASSFAIRAPYRRAIGSPFEEAVEGAEQRLGDRERARQLAHDNPALAKEVGVGRPDLPKAQDGGVVDVNNAPAAVLSRLPGVDDALAAKIVEARTHGFSSVEDLGLALDLDGDTVEALRNDVVFLPR